MCYGTKNKVEGRGGCLFCRYLTEGDDKVPCTGFAVIELHVFLTLGRVQRDPDHSISVTSVNLGLGSITNVNIYVTRPYEV